MNHSEPGQRAAAVMISYTGYSPVPMNHYPHGISWDVITAVAPASRTVNQFEFKMEFSCNDSGRATGEEHQSG